MMKYMLIVAAIITISACCKKPEPPLLSPIYESCCNTAPRYFTRDIYVPNAFTPHNKDGVNDYFFPKMGTIHSNSVIHFTIWDSDGNFIRYRAIGSNNYRDTLDYAWDGTFENPSAPLPVGSSNRTEYKGLFRYTIGFATSGGTVYNLQHGEACCIACEAGAEGLLDRVGCYFPNQEASPGTYDTIPRTIREVENLNCFIY
jgi:hypothetical protein